MNQAIGIITRSWIIAATRLRRRSKRLDGFTGANSTFQIMHEQNEYNVEQ